MVLLALFFPGSYQVACGFETRFAKNMNFNVCSLLLTLQYSTFRCEKLTVEGEAQDLC